MHLGSLDFPMQRVIMFVGVFFQLGCELFGSEDLSEYSYEDSRTVNSVRESHINCSKTREWCSAPVQKTKATNLKYS